MASRGQIGASGAISGVLGAFFRLFPEGRVLMRSARRRDGSARHDDYIYRFR